MPKEFFFHPNQVEILLSCNGECQTPSQIYKRTGITYSHVVKILRKFKEEHKLLTLTREGRLSIIRLTTKGKELCKCYENIKRIMSN